METDELLAQYLEGTLQGAERAAFEERLGASPELAEEVQELRAIEGLLGGAEQSDKFSALPFLRGVEENVVAMIASAGAAAGAGAAAAAVASKAGAAGSAAAAGAWTTWFAGAAATVGVAAAASMIYYAAVKPSEQKPQPAAQNARPSEQVQSASPAAAPTPEVAAPTSETAKDNAKETKADEAPPAAASREYSARITGSGGAKAQYAKLIDDYSRQLRAKEAQGDRAQAALLAKTLGTLHREAGDFAESQTHLQRALQDARALGVRELEAETAGELALLAEAQGKKTDALERMRECVRLWNEPALKGSDAATRWENELRRLEQKRR